jgi:ribonuclease E
MSRQRLRPSLGESSQETCPRCEGHGTIRSVESLALSILRLVEEEVMKDYTGQIIVQAPTEVINFLHNEKRAALADVEARHKVPIMMLANQYLVTPHFEILRVRKSDVSSDPSYTRVDQPDAQVVANERSQANATVVPAPAVKRIVPERPAPSRTEEKAPGLFTRLANILFSHPKEEEKSKPAQSKKTTKKTGSQRSSQQSRRRPQSSQQQSSRRTSKKRSSKGTQSSGQQNQQQRTSKKRTSKKTQSKPTQDKQGQQQSRRRPPKSQKETDGKGQVTASETASQTSIKPTASSGDVDGNVKQEQKEGSGRSSRGSRRRRSPYKTGGSKPRPERNESQAETRTDSTTGQQAAVSDKQAVTAKAEKPVQASTSPSKSEAAPVKSADKKPKSTDSAKVETKSSESKSPDTKPTETKASDTKPTETKASDTKPTETKPVDSKKAETGKLDLKPSASEPAKKAESAKPAKTDDTKTTASSADKATDAKSKPAKTTKRAPRKKTASKKVSKKTTASAKPAAKPKVSSATAPEKDSKGIYTLKPPPSE